MRLPLLSTDLVSSIRQEGTGRPRALDKARLLAAGASVLALGMINSGKANAESVPGVLQHSEDAIAINLFEVGDEETVETGATESASNPAGHALAEAIVQCADTATCSDPGEILQYARGTTSSTNGASLGGSLAIDADAVAVGASATAAGVIQIGLWQVAAAEGSGQNDLAISGMLDIGASADALAATGSAVAFAGVGAGVSQVASAIGSSGSASNSIENVGELAIIADAHAEALLMDAAASAFVGIGLYQAAEAQESASADMWNSGNILVEANASAEALNGIAVATASAAGIVQLADARTEQFASSFTSGNLLVGTTSNTPSGPSSAALSNNGVIHVDVDASAHGAIDGSATGSVLGIAQVTSGSEANAAIGNSGSIHIDATVDIVGSGTPRGVVFVSGISQAATAFSFSTVETIDQNGALTYELSSTPVGPAVASLINAGTLAVAGQVDVVALGTGSMDEGLGVAFVDGFDQYANGDGALANVDNSGAFNVSANVSVDSGNVSNAVAIASGIDQYATAFASQVTIEFASGTTTPTSITGSASAMGPAMALLDNSGSLAVLATIESHGDEVAFAGATASAIGQFAAGTDAAVVVDNSGSIISVGSISSSGRTAFGGAGAIGMQQGAQATLDADARFVNGGTLAVLASAEADGDVGAFVNATAFGAAQNVQSDEAATAFIANTGTIDIRAISSAVAGDTSTSDMAMVFAAAHGLGQLAQGKQAKVEFENSSTFQLLAEVDAAADDLAIASATASGVIQQLAIGTASGTAAARIDNSGSILVAAEADVAAGSTAAGLAGVKSAMVQSVSAGEGGWATLMNSGSIAMIADAEALAGGGDATDVGSAQAFVFGIYGAVSSTGADGFATVDLSNEGTIDINALAHATGDGLAQALATVASGLVGSAEVAGKGPAEVSLSNDGTLSLVGMAEATGGHTAHATGIAIAGMDASAISGGDAAAQIANSGELTLGADAHASAGTNALAVAIAIDGLQTTAHAGAGEALASIENGGELDMIANATASALNAQAFAIVGGTFFTGAVFQSAAAFNGDASVMVENSGNISVVADALANGEVIASASAVGGPGINQFAFATSGDAFASISNSGSLDFVAHGEANAANSAYADALFYNAVAQFANANGGVGKGTLELANEGSISLAVVADAGGDAVADAFAIASHDIGQSALIMGNDATLDFDNSGSIEIDVAALAEGSHAEAAATLATAIYQTGAALGDGGAEVSLDNSGSIDLAVLASAESPDGSAGALAALNGAVSQYAGAGSSQYVYGSTSGGLTAITQDIFPTGPASLALDNSGSVDVTVAAVAEGGTSAVASSTGLVVSQFARGADASASIVNDGSMEIELGASAQGDTSATANGSLAALVQIAAAAETTVHITATEFGGQVTDSTSTPVGTGVVSFANSGTFDLAGVGSAEADTATATMSVKGVDQTVTALDARAEFLNEGKFLIGGRAEAIGSTGSIADASALGYTVAGAGDIALDFRNKGDFTVIAEASANSGAGKASAHAVGMNVAGEGLLSGVIDNMGDLMVRADAKAGDGTAFAEAIGIKIGGNSDGLALTNTGVLAVSAVTTGGSGEATGIDTFDTLTMGAAGITIINDGGTIIARVSDDGGQTWKRGTAIDMASAAASSVLNLVGASRISGNIDLAAGQTINVTDGESWFDGIINVECQFAACGEGTLNIGAGGSLVFRHNGVDEPSAAFVEELNMASDGTLIFELPGGADSASAALHSTDPLIVANVANLDGTLLVRSGARLYEDSYQFDNLIDADVRSGEFDSCGIQGSPALLDLRCAYDSDGNVDLAIERVAFNAVDGLTRNEAAVGAGIETVYDVGLDGPFAEMVEQLFTFGEEDYGDALYQLAGASHAAYLQSFNSLGLEQNDLIDRAIDCEMNGRATSSLSCRPGKVRLWGQLDYNGRQNDGDAEVDAYEADRWTAAIGGDVEIGSDVIAGASLAKVSNRLNFHDGERSEAAGYQLGAYGAIDRGTFYARVIGTIGWYDGDSRRDIDWRSMGGLLEGRLQGDPDVGTWTLGARLGYRVALGEALLLTPFLNVDHTSARLDSFTESGVEGANLRVDDSTSLQTAVTLGAKWAADFDGIVTQAVLGYRHRFGDLRSTVEAAFAEEAGSDFDLVSAAEKRGSLLAGVSVGGKAGPVDLRVGYQGVFDGNATSHNANFRIILPLGGK